jgi:hypothetical protein
MEKTVVAKSSHMCPQIQVQNEDCKPNAITTLATYYSCFQNLPKFSFAFKGSLTSGTFTIDNKAHLTKHNLLVGYKLGQVFSR